MAITDLTKLLNLDQLQPENMTALLVAFAQGEFMIEDVLPIISAPDHFTYLKETYTTKFDSAEARGEKGEATNNAFNATQTAVSSEEWFEKYEITAKSMRDGNVFNFINLMVKGMEIIGNKIRLASERQGLEALTDTTGINTISATGAYSSYSASDPYKDIVKAKTAISLDELVKADIIVMGAENEADLKLSDTYRDVAQYTINYSPDGVPSGRIDGTRVAVANARYNSSGTLTPVLNGTIIVAASGICGNTAESLPYDAYSDYDPTVQVMSLFGRRATASYLTRPEAVCTITGA